MKDQDSKRPFKTSLVSLGLLAAFLQLAEISSASAMPDEVRLGLVISQSQYRAGLSTVKLAYDEGATIESALQNAGFDVAVKRDLEKAQLTSELARFRRKLEKLGSRGVGFVYYTGHGVQHPETKQSYLLGVEADLQSASDIVAYGISLEDLRDNFEAAYAGAVFLVFDACRNTPSFSGYKSGTKGLTRVDPALNMLIAYSTAPDDVAKEGVFAPVLAEELRRSGRLAEAAFTAAQRRIAKETAQTQMPWSDNKLYSEICLLGECDEGRRFSTDPDRELWAQVNGRSGTKALCAGYSDYVTAFPKGAYAGVAKDRLGGSICATDKGDVSYGKSIVLTSEEENRAYYEWQNDFQFSNNPKTIEGFLQRYPTGRHVEPARKKLRRLNERSR